MNHRDALLGCLAVGAVVAATALAAVPADTIPSPEALANQAFVARRYAEAYGRYAELADKGQASAASMALLMVSNGPALFGGEWSATPGQLRRWSALASRHAQERSAVIPVHDRGE